MNDCCQKYETRFCPECGKRIEFSKDRQIASLLPFLEGQAKRHRTKLASKTLREMPQDHVWVTSARRTAEKFEAWAAWVKQMQLASRTQEANK